MEEAEISKKNMEVLSKFDKALWEDEVSGAEFWEVQPKLAHYTSLDVLEKIIRDEEVWFSNPFYMNDIEELQYGVSKGFQHYTNSPLIKSALGSSSRHRLFCENLDRAISDFDENNLMNTFVFCLSEHEESNTDGLLSMWRGYGGNGSGAAIVFDTSRIQPIDGSPLIFAKVRYLSNAEREDWFQNSAKLFADCLQNNEISDDAMSYATQSLFNRMKGFALFTKHKGFEEEREWRIVYMSEVDVWNKVSHMISYFNGPNGIEPKLKFKISPMEGAVGGDVSLNDLVHSIILGPSIKGRLSLRSVRQMLQIVGRSEFVDRLSESTIPYRP